MSYLTAPWDICPGCLPQQWDISQIINACNSAQGGGGMMGTPEIDRCVLGPFLFFLAVS